MLWRRRRKAGALLGAVIDETERKSFASVHGRRPRKRTKRGSRRKLRWHYPGAAPRLRDGLRLASLCGVVAFLYLGARHVEDWTPPGTSFGQESSASCAPVPLSGAVTYVRDGDTIEVGGAVRLAGLAAPEGDEPGGSAATNAMRRMIDGREVRCELDGSRTYDRCAGVCYLAGQDIASELVRQGLARDCPRYSGGRYAAAERQAAAEGATIGAS